MSFSKKFDFPSPSEEEIKTLKMMARHCPEELDGRDIRVLQNFGGDLQ